MPNDRGWMVGLRVNVQWIVVWLSERIVFSGCEVECDISVVDDFHVALHSDF